jgi:CubicO group peptidase (beta-lactamase class C family)
MTKGTTAERYYYPPPESQGGWRWLKGAEAIREQAGMDALKLDQVMQTQEWLYGGDSWGIVIIRHGYLVREHYTFNVLIPTRFDVWSCTKTFTGTAWGLLLDDSRKGRLPVTVDLDSPAYEFIPEGQPLSDPDKARITIRHLLTMTSGFKGEKWGIACTPTATGEGPLEHALGRCPNRYGKWVDRLAGEPGTVWDYSDPAFTHLSLIFTRITGQQMSDYLQERVLDPIGIEGFTWDVQGGSGSLGPLTNAHTGVHISAREMARFGYLALHGGTWNGQQVVPAWWLELATQTSQDLNPAYGYTWWVNTKGARWPGLPKDMFALEGYRANRCYIIPSLDLVVARVGGGPPMWDEGGLIRSVIATLVDRDGPV